MNYSSCTGSTWAAITAYLSSEDYGKFDWHQKRRSQLIDYGTMDIDYRPADSVTRDLDGNPRIIGRRIDLGCWEVEAPGGIRIFVR